MSDVLVIGYGSIGARHARLLADRGESVSVVTKRSDLGMPVFHDVAAALAQTRPELIVVANETADHWSTLQTLATLRAPGTILVEKPLSHRLPPRDQIADMQTCLNTIVIGYNLRFHPAILTLRQRIHDRDLVSVIVYAGQDLNAWRPDQRVSDSYSADAARGGGVLRDLSHELDYIGWLCGAWTRVTALGGRLGGLSIQSDDGWGILMKTERCPLVSLCVDYYHRPGARTIIVNLPDETISVDLVAGTYRDANGMQSWNLDRNSTYVAQSAAILAGDFSVACSVGEGLETVALIEEIEESARQARWITR